MENIDFSKIDNMSGQEFEEVVSRLLYKMGFEVETTKVTGDGGIDIIAKSEKPIIEGRYIIQCKRHDSNISEPVIRDLFGVMTSERANKGILITNSCFTTASIAFAKEKPIELIDGDNLRKLLEKYFPPAENENKNQYDLSYNQKILFDSIIDVIDDLREEYQAVKKGLIFNKNYEHDLDSFFNIIQSENDNILSFINAMKGFFDSFTSLQTDADVSSKRIKKQVERFRDFLDEYVKEWKEFYFIKVDDKLDELKASFLELHDSFFDSLFKWCDSLKIIIKNPEGVVKNGEASCSFVLDETRNSEKLEKISQLLAGIYDKTTSNQNELALNPSDRVYYEGLAEILNDCKKEYDAVKNGIVFKNNKDIDFEKFTKLVQGDIDVTYYFFNAIENFINVSAEFLNGNGSIEDAENLVGNFNDTIKGFVRGWQKYNFLVVPSNCKRLHEVVLERYDIVFSYLFKYLEKINKLLNNSPEVNSDGTIEISFEMNSEIIMEKTNEMIEVNNTIVERQNSKASSGCFIATATYGTPLANEVRILCKFRDTYLLKYFLGRKFVSQYYRISPSISKYIASRPVLKKLIRKSLSPIVLICDKILKKSD